MQVTQALTRAVHDDLLRVPSAGDARPPRVAAAALHHDRLRAVQPGDRSGDDQRVDAARLSRGRRRSPLRGCRGSSPGRSGTAGGRATSTPWPTSTTRWAASTRPSATARPAPSTATSRGPKFAGRPVTDVQWYRPAPPTKKLRWSLRNNTNYMEAGALSALEYAALHRRGAARGLLDQGGPRARQGEDRRPPTPGSSRPTSAIRPGWPIWSTSSASTGSRSTG